MHEGSAKVSQFPLGVSHRPGRPFSCKRKGPSIGSIGGLEGTTHLQISQRDITHGPDLSFPFVGFPTRPSHFPMASLVGSRAQGCRRRILLVSLGNRKMVHSTREKMRTNASPEKWRGGPLHFEALARVKCSFTLCNGHKKNLASGRKPEMPRTTSQGNSPNRVFA